MRLIYSKERQLWRTGRLISKRLQSKKRICSEVSVNSPGDPWSQSGRRKVGYGGKDLQKRKVLSLEWKSEGVIDDESGEFMELVKEVP